jgi:hypothetical protein
MSKPDTPDFTDRTTQSDYQTLLELVDEHTTGPDTPALLPCDDLIDEALAHGLSWSAALGAYSEACDSDIVRLAHDGDLHVVPYTEAALRAVIEAESAKPAPERDTGLIGECNRLVQRLREDSE